VRLDRRVLTYIIIALIVGVALALAVALSHGDGSAAGAGGSGGVAGSTGASAVYADDGEAAALAPADPAKEEPLLDKFSSKDPFIPFGTPSTPVPQPTSTPTTSLSAKIKVDGTTYNVMQGDKVPGGSAAEFTIASVTSGRVTFSVIDGALKNGDTSFPVDLGEAVRVTLDSGVSYDISVISIGGSGGTTDGHTIMLLSVSSQNGTALATLEVDGKTYSDKKVGDVFSTSWGEIEILEIDVSAQTVKILHGDQVLVLHVGQVIVK